MKNILLIQTDQMRFDCLGANGNPYVKTPNLDRLAQEGANFSRHIVANPLCMPSRASLFTGLYPPAHNVWNNGVPLNRLKYIPHDHGFYTGKSFDGQTLKTLVEPPTLAEIFRDNGYQTCMFGKLHLTPHSAPAAYEFEESEAFWESEDSTEFNGPYFGFEKAEIIISHGDRTVFKGGSYTDYMKAEHPDLYDRCLKNAGNKKGPSQFVPDMYVSDVPEKYHTSAWLADRFIDYCDTMRDSNKPFLAYLGFPDPHHPFTPSCDVVEDFENIDVKQWDCEQEKMMKNSPFAKYLYNTAAGTNQVTELTDEENFPLAYIYNFRQPEFHSYTICDQQYRLSWYPIIDQYELYDSRNDPNECDNLYDQLKNKARIKKLKNILKEKIPGHTNPILAKPCGW